MGDGSHDGRRLAVGIRTHLELGIVPVRDRSPRSRAGWVFGGSADARPRHPARCRGALLLDPARHLPVSGAALPVMPTPEIQTSWTGSHGGTLLRQSVAFIRSLVAAAGDDLYRGPVLDYGVGWARLSRLLLKYVAVEQMVGVDSWQRSLDTAEACAFPTRYDWCPLDSRRGSWSRITTPWCTRFRSSLTWRPQPRAQSSRTCCRAASRRPTGRDARPAEFWAMSGYPHADPAKIEPDDVRRDRPHRGGRRR